MSLDFCTALSKLTLDPYVNLSLFVCLCVCIYFQPFVNASGSVSVNVLIQIVGVLSLAEQCHTQVYKGYLKNEKKSKMKMTSKMNITNKMKTPTKN